MQQRSCSMWPGTTRETLKSERARRTLFSLKGVYYILVHIILIIRNSFKAKTSTQRPFSNNKWANKKKTISTSKGTPPLAADLWYDLYDEWRDDASTDPFTQPPSIRRSIHPSMYPFVHPSIQPSNPPYMVLLLLILYIIYCMYIRHSQHISTLHIAYQYCIFKKKKKKLE